MKIGIITYYNAPNYGAFMQAYALNEYLKNKGCDVDFLEVSKFKKYDGENEFRKNFESIISQCNSRLKIGNSSEVYDLIIYGSDEIWNLRNHGYLPKLWGWGFRAHKRISYAPSLGNTRWKDLLLFPYTIFGIRRLNGISARDESSYNILKRFTRKKIERVLDPTFLINYDSLLSDYDDKNYILIYSYGINNNQCEAVLRYAKENKLKIISTGHFYEWADMNLTPTPFEWLNMINNAKVVFTSTFHGTVFSVIFRKNFFVFKTQSPKVLDLLSKFGLNSRMFSSYEDVLKANTIDYQDTETKIKDLVRISKDFLQAYLK